MLWEFIELGSYDSSMIYRADGERVKKAAEEEIWRNFYSTAHPEIITVALMTGQTLEDRPHCRYRVGFWIPCF